MWIRVTLVAGSRNAIRDASSEALATCVELLLPIAGVPPASGPMNPSHLDSFDPGPPDLLAGRAIHYRHSAPASGNQKRITAELWDVAAGMLDNGRGRGGRGGAYVI
ncbi:hypothetical protein GRAN_0356 [Granulicella sibirica]|uniref:Uncharacterized protein n=1 Tax=Granulicella sibirica TaxID=2479048 RepID=A0A4Q0T5Z7_9BACT|nr:hypothetical protein GRAN_0356 [Granulicella sibirica]